MLHFRFYSEIMIIINVKMFKHTFILVILVITIIMTFNERKLFHFQNIK